MPAVILENLLFFFWQVTLRNLRAFGEYPAACSLVSMSFQERMALKVLGVFSTIEPQKEVDKVINNRSDSSNE